VEVAKVRETLAVGTQAAQKFDMGKSNLRKLNELEVRKQYQIEITNRFAAWENLNDCDTHKWGLRKTLTRKLKPQKQKDQVCTNCSSINHGLMKNVYDFDIKRSRLN